MGGTFVWVDPAQELVGAYFEVCLRMDEKTGLDQLWNSDIFQNLIASALED